MRAAVAETSLGLGAEESSPSFVLPSSVWAAGLPCWCLPVELNLALRVTETQLLQRWGVFALTLGTGSVPPVFEVLLCFPGIS